MPHRPLETASRPRAAAQARTSPAPQRRSACDRLGYVADLIGELETMAAEAGCPRLAGLLAEAGSEARARLADRADE